MKQFTIRGSFEYPPRFEDAIELLDTARPVGPHHPHAAARRVRTQGLAMLEGSKDCGKVMITMGRMTRVTQPTSRFDFTGTRSS